MGTKSLGFVFHRFAVRNGRGGTTEEIGDPVRPILCAFMAACRELRETRLLEASQMMVVNAYYIFGVQIPSVC